MNTYSKPAVECAVAHLISLSEFRNYNEIYYILIDDKWLYFHPCNARKYKYTHYAIQKHVYTHLNTLESSNKKIAAIIKKKDTRFVNKIINGLFEHVKTHISNTAIDNSHVHIPLPLPIELNQLICEFIPNDASINFIDNIKNKILLPKNELIAQLVKLLPHIENTPEIIEIYCKYIDMYVANDLLKMFRDKMVDEFHEKKSYPRNNSGKYMPLFKCDDKIIRKFIYLNSTGYSSCNSMILCIKYTMEQSLYSEIKQFRDIRMFEKREYFKTKFNLYHIGIYSEIEIMTYIFDGCNGVYSQMFYKNDWRNEIPELLSNTTNTLTSRDMYMIKQYPQWVKCILKNASDNISKMTGSFSKQEIIQNKCGYDDLQDRKNECKRELKIIEKFTK
jgi:hypothetical protein